METVCPTCGAQMVPMIFSSFCPNEEDHAKPYLGGTFVPLAQNPPEPDRVLRYLGTTVNPQKNGEVWHAYVVKWLVSEERGWWVPKDIEAASKDADDMRDRCCDDWWDEAPAPPGWKVSSGKRELEPTDYNVLVGFFR